jgi:hypothetical protein
MCGMSLPMVILILAIEVFVIGYFIVEWISRTGKAEAERYKNPPPKIDPRITYEMLESYLREKGESVPAPDSDSSVVLLLLIVAAIAAIVYLSFFFS